VFCAGIVLGFLARLGLEYDDHLPMQAAINLFGAAGMIAVGALAAWFRTKDRKGPRSASSVPLTTSASASSLLPLSVRADTGQL
jgi:hypothetical protein